jgi:hypothetical protein
MLVHISTSVKIIQLSIEYIFPFIFFEHGLFKFVFALKSEP